MAGFFCSIRNPSFFPLAPVKRVLFLQAMALYLATLRGLGTVEFRLRLFKAGESFFFSREGHIISANRASVVNLARDFLFVGPV